MRPVWSLKCNDIPDPNKCLVNYSCASHGCDLSGVIRW
jgi:hypothetical protein